MYTCSVPFLTCISGTVDNNDYSPLTMELTFTTGALTRTVNIETSMDMVIEDPETFTLSLTSTDPAVTGMIPSATVSITDQTTSE